MTINIWIGYDNQFSMNNAIQEESIRRHCSKDLKINYLKLSKLQQILTREREVLQSTDSAFTRWLVPYLTSYSGWHLYMDSDMMLRDDISKIWDLKDESKAVMVVKHPMYNISSIKFNNNIQLNYERKYWSSLILFNCNKCRALNLDYVNAAKGLDLHQFKWIADDLIGELPMQWNHLVGVEEHNNEASLVHWTNGGPWFDEYKNCEFSSEWRQIYASLVDSR
jgi:lipopolysaccharide biosynthesis glycosyltransferase